MKNQSNLSKLMAYAGKHRVLTYLSWVLSVISALVALVPFWYIWCIIRDVLAVAPILHRRKTLHITVGLPYCLP